jgi:hypothetical protein
MRRHAISLSFFSLLSAGALLAQMPCLDQSYPGNSGNGLEVTSNQPVTQTFTVGITGQLTSVDLLGFRHHRGINPNPLQVDIVATSAGKPTNTVLSGASVPSASIPTTPTTIQVTLPGIAVTSGQVLGLRLTTVTGPSQQTYAWAGDAPGTYARGDVYIQASYIGPLTWDMGFGTWVVAKAGRFAYGQGHRGTNGVPSLGASADPVLGKTIQLQLGNSQPGASPGVLLLGVRELNLPTPFDGVLLVDPLVAASVLVLSAQLQLPLAIPQDNALCGLKLYFQSVLRDLGASKGLAFSPGLRLELGW